MNNPGAHIVGDSFDPARLIGPYGATPRVVKLLDPSYDFKARVRAVVGPDCLIVIRFYEADQALGAPDTDARWWYSKHVSQMLTLADPNVAFESYNEIVDGQARAYAQFEAVRLGLMHAAGFRAVVLNASMGTPDLPTWTYYQPMLDAMLPSDYVGLHEYWTRPEDIDNRWLCGRWTMVPQLAGKAIVITECGREPGGWKTAGISTEQYISEIERYAQVCGDIPATVYTGGALTAQWEPYSVNDIWPMVTAGYTATQPAPQPPPAQEKYVLRQWLRKWETWKVTTPYSATHPWVDLARGKGTLGAALLAPFDGVVDIVNWRDDRGWYLYLYDETQGIEFYACHLMIEPYVAPGDHVKAGFLLGVVGNTGQSTGPHLHCGVCRVNDKLQILEWLDPLGSQIEIVEG
jgi:hypothetical protein